MDKMSEDWKKVTILRKNLTPSQINSESYLNQARRTGAEIETYSRFGASSNKQSKKPLNAERLDRETEELKHERIPLDVCKRIMQGRQAKGLSQKDLANKINEKHYVIADYEAGRGFPNEKIFSKIERVLGIKLRCKEPNHPLNAPPKNETVIESKSDGWTTVTKQKKPKTANGQKR